MSAYLNINRVQFSPTKPDNGIQAERNRLTPATQGAPASEPPVRDELTIGRRVTLGDEIPGGDMQSGEAVVNEGAAADSVDTTRSNSENAIHDEVIISSKARQSIAYVSAVRSMTSEEKKQDYAMVRHGARVVPNVWLHSLTTQHVDAYKINT